MPKINGKHYDQVLTNLVKIEYEFGPKWNADRPDFVIGADKAEVERIVDRALRDRDNFNARRKRTHRHNPRRK